MIKSNGLWRGISGSVETNRVSPDTDADKELLVVKEGIGRAVTHLSRIVVDECSGYDDWNSRYKDKLRNALSDLLSLRDGLDEI